MKKKEIGSEKRSGSDGYESRSGNIVCSYFREIEIDNHNLKEEDGFSFEKRQIYLHKTFTKRK